MNFRKCQLTLGNYRKDAGLHLNDRFLAYYIPVLV